MLWNFFFWTLTLGDGETRLTNLRLEGLINRTKTPGPPYGTIKFELQLSYIKSSIAIRLVAESEC